MEKLSSQISLLSSQEGELLSVDKLSKNRQNKTGLYLVCEPNKYTAYDYSDRQSWIEYFNDDKNAPEGFSKQFKNPLSAIDWLLEVK